MSSREPFFEPPLPPPEEPERDRQFANVPWSPPINVVPVVVPIGVDVVVTDDVVIRVMDAQAYGRGVLLRVETWVHPESAMRAQDRHGMPEEPQVGMLLGDGTKVGAGGPGHSPDVGPGEPGTASAPLFVNAGGGAGELRVTQTWWVSPVPDGAAEMVVAWTALDVPETFVPLDLDVVRDASARAKELWPLPDVEDGSYGWFAYAPGGHTAYTSSLGHSLDGDDDDSAR
ncbi:hypothetical protein V6K52_08470 [Knoellia sp. S7-12]|uniref:hypothetical protein n=1 Tax=Knoellia sp. S7-12 TaxID=3126698 RepID=UPI003367F174